MEIFWIGYLGIMLLIFFSFFDSLIDTLKEIRNELKRINKKE